MGFHPHKASLMRRIASGVAFLLLFSALSPAFAAVFKQGPDFGDLCTAQGLRHGGNSDGPQQAAKTIHCAWCLSSAAQPALGSTPARLFAAPDRSHEIPLSAVPVSPSQAGRFVYLSQAPPRFL